MDNAIDILTFELYKIHNHIRSMKMMSDEVQCDLVKGWPEQAKEIEAAIERLKSAELAATVPGVPAMTTEVIKLKMAVSLIDDLVHDYATGTLYKDAWGTIRAHVAEALKPSHNNARDETVHSCCNCGNRPIEIDNMSRSWPKFGDNPDKYRNLKNSDEDCAAEIVESAHHIDQQPKGKSLPKVKGIKVAGKPSPCQFDSAEGCIASVCYSGEKCNSRDGNGNPRYL